MSALEKRLLGQINKIALIDPHTHIVPAKAASRHLDDLLGYHYYTELAHSTGMDQSPLAANVPPEVRIKAIARFLPQIENTAQYSWILEIARTLLGFRKTRIDETTVEELARLAVRKMAQPKWEDHVLAAGNFDAVFLTNDFDESLTGFDTQRYVPCLRTDELVFRLDQAAVRDRLAALTKTSVSDAASLRKALAAVFERFKGHGAKACAIGLPPDFAPRQENSDSIDPLLRRVLTGQEVTASESHAVNRFAFWTICQLAGEFNLPFFLMIGAVRGIYPAGVHQGRDLFNRLTSLAQYADLFNGFPKVKFPVSIIDSAQNPELIAFSWILPNVYTAGHWWYANSPALIERDLRQRLCAVPRTKQIGYYSDAYKLEFTLPKFNMYRRVLARVLAEDFVQDRGWPEAKALDLARDLLRRNVERIFYAREG